MAIRILHIAQARQDRLHRRYYPLELPFSYIALGGSSELQRGWGETIEMNSRYVLVKPLSPLNPDATDIVMSIVWPARLSDGTNLQLVIHAQPVWESTGLGGFRILKHEFRTAGKDANGLCSRAELRTGKGGSSDEQSVAATSA